MRLEHSSHCVIWKAVFSVAAGNLTQSHIWARMEVNYVTPYLFQGLRKLLWSITAPVNNERYCDSLSCLKNF